MSWQKHFRAVSPNGKLSPISGNTGNRNSHNAMHSNFSSFLPEVYTGQANRIQRYAQYDDMDRDGVINMALDTIADFCTQGEEHKDSQFVIDYLETPTDTEVTILNEQLIKWTRLNNFKSRLWHLFRGTIKYGDQFFVRDPETFELLWVPQYNVDLVRVDASKGKVPIEYTIRNLDYNKVALLAAVPADTSQYANMGTNNQQGQANAGAYQANASSFPFGGGANTNTSGVTNAYAVKGTDVVHASLNSGMDAYWPFGKSILENVFRVFKQKELLEDAAIIYKVQRAPERRVFKIDVGEMDPARANAHIDRIKNEIHQRRIPNRNGSGNSAVDAAYNPLSMLEDYFFAVTPDGRGSSVDVLQGGGQAGDITDLEYFNKELKNALGIPSTYMAGDDNATYTDGRVGTAQIQEYRFNKYCMRLQSLISPTFDKEFKEFLKHSGVNIEGSLFELSFSPPQNFSAYRQIELDEARINVYSGIADNGILSERFKLIRYLGLTEDELLENEKMWMEENPDKIKQATGSANPIDDDGDGLSAVGITDQSSSDDIMDDTESSETTEKTETSGGSELPDEFTGSEEI